jgi:hypothetical protein
LQLQSGGTDRIDVALLRRQVAAGAVLQVQLHLLLLTIQHLIMQTTLQAAFSHPHRLHWAEFYDRYVGLDAEIIRRFGPTLPFAQASSS